MSVIQRLKTYVNFASTKCIENSVKKSFFI